MANSSCGGLEVYDYGNGSVLIEWRAFGGPAPDSYNVYVNGVLNQNVTTLFATVTGLLPTSYAVAAVAPTPNNSTRPQSMPPVGVVTPSQSYAFTVTAVKSGVETSVSRTKNVTVQPTSIMLTTPMKRIFPFPNTGLN